MTLTARILGAFGVRPDEAERVGWMLAYSAFIGVFFSFYLTVANALFLGRFDISVLPLGYLASAAIGYSLVQVFSKVERAIAFSRLVVLNLVFLVLLATAFWFLISHSESDAVVFVAWSCVGAMFSLVFLGYWKLAARLFDLRQGKRLFALIGAGEEISTIIGLFSIPLLIGWLGGAKPLLLFAVAGQLGCLLVVLGVVMRFKDLVGGDKEVHSAAERKQATLGNLVKKRYFLIMAGLAVLLTLAEYIVDFSFLSQIQVKFGDAAQIAQFIGVFFGGVKILELGMKVFVSGRLLNQFGLKVGLLVLPGLLGICAVLAVVIGSMGTAATHFFVLVALAKLVWVVARTSTFLPSFRVLYQPVPAAERQAFETHVSGTATQLSIGLVGLALMVFSRSPTFNAMNLFYLLGPVLVAWISLVIVVHKKYRIRLMANLAEQKGQVVTASQVETLVASLRQVPAGQLENAAAVLARVDATAVVPMLESIAGDGEDDRQIAALRYVNRLKAVGARAVVERVAEGDPSPEVRSEAEKTLATIKEVEILSEDPERVRELAASGLSPQRDLAVSAIGYSAEPDRHMPLTDLLWDKDLDVRRAALVAAGRVGNPAYWHRIVSQLFSPRYSNAASYALVTIGEPVLGDLEKAFHRADSQLRARILRIYERIDHPRARQLLVGKLSFPDRDVRYHALLSLNRCGYKVAEEEEASVVNEVENLIAGVAWNMAAILELTGAGSAMEELRHSLELEIRHSRRSLFLLLSLLYDQQSIKLVKDNLDSGNPGAVVYALEILELLISPELKPLVFPVLEDVSYQMVIKRLDSMFPRYRLTQQERLSAIANRGYDQVSIWTRACSLRAIAEASDEVEPDLISALFHPERIIREVAAKAIQEKNGDALPHYLNKLPEEQREQLAELVEDSDGAQWTWRSIFGRVSVFRDLPALSALPLEALVVLSEGTEERFLKADQRLPSSRDTGAVTYVIFDGEVAVVDEANGEKRTVDEMPALAVFSPGSLPVEATEPSRAARIDPSVLYEVAAEYAELLPALLRVGSLLPEDSATETASIDPGEGAWPEAQGIGMPV